MLETDVIFPNMSSTVICDGPSSSFASQSSRPWVVRRVVPEDKAAALGELSDNVYDGHDYL